MTTREDVIRMAREAGFDYDKLDNEIIVGYYGDNVTPQLERFAEIAAAELVAAERERCAKVCEDRGNRNRIAAGLPNGDRDEFYCADDIRALP